jgi:hypothetical protein
MTCAAQNEFRLLTNLILAIVTYDLIVLDTVFKMVSIFYNNIGSCLAASLLLSDKEATPSGENVSVRKPDHHDFSGLLTFFAYRSPFLSSLRKFDWAATEAPPSRGNNSIRKKDPDFLLVVY